MKRRLILGGVLNVLLAVIATLFLYPHQMIAPGALMPSHAKLEQNCFACHAPLQGVSSDRCIACHKPSQIGLTTTTGQRVRRPFGTPLFHAQLRETNCTACHTDHAKVPLAPGKLARFDHALL
jgi:ribosomal protein L34E